MVNFNAWQAGAVDVHGAYPDYPHMLMMMLAGWLAMTIFNEPNYYFHYFQRVLCIWFNVSETRIMETLFIFSSITVCKHDFVHLYLDYG